MIMDYHGVHLMGLLGDLNELQYHSVWDTRKLTEPLGATVAAAVVLVTVIMVMHKM